MNNYQENLNKKIEETKKNFEKMFSCPVSYHEEGGWDGKNGHFTIKLGRKFKNPEIERQKNELIEENIKNDIKQVEKPKETLTYIIKADIDGKEYSVERKDKDDVIKESYCEARRIKKWL